MKNALILVALVIVGAAILITLNSVLLCPEYVNRMPMVIDEDYKPQPIPFGEKLFNLGLCPTTKVAY